MLSDLLIGVDGCQHLSRLAALVWCEHGAYFLAGAALHTERHVNLGIAKSLGILVKGYAVLGTSLNASLTATTITLVGDINHKYRNNISVSQESDVSSAVLPIMRKKQPTAIL